MPMVVYLTSMSTRAEPSAWQHGCHGLLPGTSQNQFHLGTASQQATLLPCWRFDSHLLSLSWVSATVYNFTHVWCSLHVCLACDV